MNSRLFLLLPTIFVIYCKSCQGQCSSNPCDNGGSCVAAGNVYTCNCPADNTGPRCEGKNWALRKPATQSTTSRSGFGPSRAVDGLRGTEALTTDDKNSWWRVDLETVLNVAKVVMETNGTYIDNMVDANVVVGIYFGVYKMCGPHKFDMTRSNGRTVYCSSGVTGNIVLILNRGEQLSCVALIEVSVYGSEHLRGQCVSNPCDNGGTCQPNGTFYNCMCPPNWNGPNCEGKNWALGKRAEMSSLLKPLFKPSSAVDGNTIDLNIHDYAFHCVSSKKEQNPVFKIQFGELLEVRKIVIVNRQDCCSTNLKNFEIHIGPFQQNYKTCGPARNYMSDVARMSITCSSGVMGTGLMLVLYANTYLNLCEVEVYASLIPCSSSPCRSGLECQRIGEGFSYKCACPSNMTRSICEGLIPCLRNPCINGGICNETNMTSYTCVCPSNFAGSICEHLITCFSSPCINGGTCNENMTSYSCVCPAEWTGINCEDSAICLSNPCENGGKCELYENVTMSFTCSCPAEWRGTHCETRTEVRGMSTEMKLGIGLGVAASAVVGGAVVATGLASGAGGGHSRDITSRLGSTLVGRYARSALCLPPIEEEDEEEEEDEAEEKEEEDISMWNSFLNIVFGSDNGNQPEPSPSATQTPATG